MSEDEKNKFEEKTDKSLNLKDEEFVIDENDDDDVFEPFIDDKGFFSTSRHIEYHMREWGISGNRYSLDEIDDTAREYLSSFKHRCKLRDDEAKLDIIIARSE